MTTVSMALPMSMNRTHNHVLLQVPFAVFKDRISVCERLIDALPGHPPVEQRLHDASSPHGLLARPPALVPVFVERIARSPSYQHPSTDVGRHSQQDQAGGEDREPKAVAI